MATTGHKACIVRAHLLDRSGTQDIGRMIYSLLIFDPGGTQIVARPFSARTLDEVIAYVLKHGRRAGIGRVKFETPGPVGIDGIGSKHPRRYEALTLHEIYHASPALGQS